MKQKSPAIHYQLPDVSLLVELSDHGSMPHDQVCSITRCSDVNVAAFDLALSSDLTFPNNSIKHATVTDNSIWSGSRWLTVTDRMEHPVVEYLC